MPTIEKDIDINVLSELGLDCAKNGNLEDGIFFLERNTVEFPDSARSHFELANIYLKNNNKIKAIEEYKKTLVISPDHLIANEALKSLLNNI